MNTEQYTKLDFSDIKTDPDLSRRDFLKSVGGGIVILFCIGDNSLLEARRGGQSLPSDFNAFLRIGADGRVSCFTGKIEMGQGIITSLAQMLADELDVSLDSVDMVMGDTDLCPYDMGTWGSMSTRFFGPPLRAAGAEARKVLIELASKQLDVPVNNLAVENGVVSDKNKKDKSVTYAELAKGNKLARSVSQTAIKNPSEFKVMGKEFLHHDAKDKVTGKAKYTGDIRIPGMLYAAILRPPAHGAALKNVDTSPAEQVEGAKVIREGDLIAVLHKNPDEAREALSRIKAEYDESTFKEDDKTIFDFLLATAGNGSVLGQSGDLQAGEKQSDSILEQAYYDGYVAHAPIETHTALAQIEGDKVTVWASTQSPFGIKDQIASALGTSSSNVRVITPFVGGGFGGKAPGQQAIEAARLAKAVGKPVQVTWTREDEFFYDTFRPAAIVKIKSGINKEGKLMLWNYNVYYAGDRGAELFYHVPNHRETSLGGPFGGPNPHPFATGPWRAPANNTNTFARESQIDIMAANAKTDPLEFRLKNLSDERMIRILKAAADKFGWTSSVAPSGKGIGIACGTDADTYVATIAQVEVDKRTGHVQVKRVVCAQDMGLSINPEGARIQMEGCITMGLGYALTEHVRFKGGRILEHNFDTYQIPRFTSLPKIETVILDLKDQPAHGGGEPAIICMGAVIANAIYDAAGIRIFQLPLSQERIKDALTKKNNST